MKEEIKKLKQVIECQRETIEELSEELAKRSKREIEYPLNGTANIVIHIIHE